MSFCSRIKIKNNLQIPRRRKMLFGSVRTGRRASLGAPLRGSMTLETAFVLPFLLCAVTALLYLFAFTSVQAKESLQLVERAKLLAVTVGQNKGSDPYIKLADADLASPPFFDLPFGRRIMTKRAVVRAWVGFTGETFQNNAGEVLVYVTPGGTVYHRTRDCTYLSLSVRQTSYNNVRNERNQSGSRYTACEYCITRGWSKGTVYITDYGTSYHSSTGCQGLRRTVMVIPLSETGERPCCSRCSR